MEQSNLKINMQLEITFLNSVATKLFLYPRSDQKNWKYYGYRLIYSLLALTVIQLTFSLYLKGFKNLAEFTIIAPNIGVCLLSALKYTVVHSNKKFYDKFFQHFGEDIWNKNTKYSRENKKIISKYTFITKVINRVFLLYALPLIVVVDLFPWLIMMIEHKILGRDIKYLYPFDGLYPFDKVHWYYAIYTWESLMTAIVIFIYMYSDMVNIFTVACLCMEFRIVGNSFKNLITEDELVDLQHLQNDIYFHARIKNRLKNIIAEYELISSMSKMLDGMLGNIMLANYTFGCIFICLTAFTFTVVDDLFQSIRCLCFFLSLVAAVMDHCIIGQILGDHSKNLAEDLYTSNWIHADQSTKKMILFLIMRMQKPFTLTAHKIVVMDLATFTDIMGTSYQFFNLLRTVYQPYRRNHDANITE